MHFLVYPLHLNLSQGISIILSTKILPGWLHTAGAPMNLRAGETTSETSTLYPI